jgi:hypothetical protein
VTLDWPLAVVVVAALGCAVLALKVALPYLVGASSERARQAALADISKRLNAVEAHVAQGSRRMPGRLG